MTTNNPWPFPMNKPNAVAMTSDLAKKTAVAFEAYRTSLVAQAIEMNIKIVHIFDKEYPKGGLTVAFRKTMPHQTSTNMVQVSVATCSLADNFSRKTGTFMALAKFEKGETIELPLSSGHKDEDLNAIVKDFFSNIAYVG